MTGFLLRFALCPTLDKGRHHSIFQRRKFGQEVMKLKYISNTAIAKVGQGTIRKAYQVNSTTVYGALCRTIQPPHEMQECAFPGARWPYNGDHVPCSYVQVHTA